MGKIRGLAHSFILIFLIVVGIQALGMLAMGKQFAYELSQMDRSLAFKTVSSYLAQRGLLYEWLNEKQVEHYVNAYLDGELEEMTNYDKALLSAYRNQIVKNISKAIAGVTLGFLIYLELYSAYKFGKLKKGGIDDKPFGSAEI